MAEAFNTAIEIDINLTSPEIHPSLGIRKMWRPARFFYRDSRGNYWRDYLPARILARL